MIEEDILYIEKELKSIMINLEKAFSKANVAEEELENLSRKEKILRDILNILNKEKKYGL